MHDHVQAMGTAVPEQEKGNEPYHAQPSWVLIKVERRHLD